MQAYPWLSEYPPGVPQQIDPREHSSLVELFESSCRQYVRQTAFVCMDVELGFAKLDALSRQFAAYLQHSLGLRRGDRVALMMPNVLQYPVALFGVLRAGLVAVNVNPLYTPRELEHQLRDSGARAIVILENFCHTLQQVLANTAVEKVITTQLGDMAPAPRRWLVNAVVKYQRKLVPAWQIKGATSFRQSLASGARQTFKPVTVGHADIAFLQYTGGTTGLSKGAVLTHGNMVANMLQVRSWMRDLLRPGEEVIITALPLYHIFALMANCLTFMSIGAKNVLITNPRDMPGFVRELGKHRFTALTGVNTLFNGLLNTPGFEQLDFSQLRLTLGGGAAVQQAVAERWRKVTGKPLSEAYGLTEASPAVSMTPIDKPDWNGTIGVPLPSTVISLRDDDNHEVPPGQPGELCVSGPQVMQGYWNKPEENAQVFTADGYLRTGDVAAMDERGYFRIVDRKKDMILVSGFNVFPNEIEAVVALHAGVLECACVGVADEKSGEAVKVFVVRRDPSLTVDVLLGHCREHLTGYKVPRHIAFLDELPKSNVGKILRRELRNR